MWAKLKRGYQKFRDDAPGERFLKSHERWKHHGKGPAATIFIAGSGTILIVGGFLLGLIPGVPGIVLGVLGFAMFATRFRRLAIWLDVCEVKARQTWKRCRRILAR